MTKSGRLLPMMILTSNGMDSPSLDGIDVPDWKYQYTSR
jgi:hypothetical protein